MNLRALTRGDAAVAGAAVLLFIASFLPYLTADCSGRFCADASKNAWSTDLFPVLPSIYLLGIVAAVLILVQRFQGQAATNRQVLGLRLDQWGIAFSVAALWTSVWSLGASPYGSSVSHGFGAWLGFIALIVLAGAAAASPLVPALKAPLASDRPAAVPGQYGYPGQPGHPGAPGQYGYPAPGQDPAYGAAQGGYGYPGAGQPQPGQPVQAAQPHEAAAPAPQPAPAAQQAAAPASDFQPFWFAVPAPRQLAPKDNPAGAPVGEVVPGTWYLAVEQRGAALVAQLPDGSQGVLADTTGIQRG
ncbi:hypothetical protein ACIQI7_10720 [Kitasatospora sp. NPDC092039]|uniref:hypothetical protein n=1 Tax=Kitasatospora sp. NPDC092039 TaxID=3364086 RepID=UPI0038067284